MSLLLRPRSVEPNRCHGNACLATVNPNAWSTAKGVLEWCASSLEGGLPEALAIQETRIRNEQEATSAKRWAFKQGSKAHLGLAQSAGLSQNHFSAGVGVVAKQELGLASLKHPALENWSHRIAAIRHDLGLSVDVLLLSVYLEDSMAVVVEQNRFCKYKFYSTPV